MTPAGRPFLAGTSWTWHLHHWTACRKHSTRPRSPSTGCGATADRTAPIGCTSAGISLAPGCGTLTTVYPPSVCWAGVDTPRWYRTGTGGDRREDRGEGPGLELRPAPAGDDDRDVRRHVRARHARGDAVRVARLDRRDRGPRAGHAADGDLHEHRHGRGGAGPGGRAGPRRIHQSGR